MNKDMKMAAIKEMAEGSGEYMEPHMAVCPNCGHEFMMGEEGYEEQE